MKVGENNLMDNILNKYSNSVLRMLDQNNTNRIVEFLRKKNCIYIDDIFQDYLDIFTIGYEEFIEKFNFLNEKYDNKFLEIAEKNMNILEEFFNN